MRKTAVITGSARGLGLEMAKQFRRNNFNVVISDVNEERLQEAVKKLNAESGPFAGTVSCLCDVTNVSDLEKLWNTAAEQFHSVDVWSTMPASISRWFHYGN